MNQPTKRREFWLSDDAVLWFWQWGAEHDAPRYQGRITAEGIIQTIRAYIKQLEEAL